MSKLISSIRAESERKNRAVFDEARVAAGARSPKVRAMSGAVETPLSSAAAPHLAICYPCASEPDGTL
jgi:hypothetical protein